MALLKRVIIDNFRNLSHREIDLGIKNIIEGKNMSGKTNSLNAIHWAFTGTTLDGSNDNRSNMQIVELGVAQPPIEVTLDFGDFTFERVCQLVGGTPSVSIYVNGEETTVKNGEAQLHKYLELTDFILKYPKFNIIKFLLNPLYFETVAPKDLRKFFYSLADISLNDIQAQQNQKIQDIIKYYLTNEPYALCEAIDKRKKGLKKNIETCKGARLLFPSIEEESRKLEKEQTKLLVQTEGEEALANKYTTRVAMRINEYYKKAMGIQVCLLEKGVGDDVYKDVCYPILPKSNLPFALGSYAERSYVGMRFIQEVCLKYNIKPLPILLDNMESLDSNTEYFVDSLGVQYIGAKVIY